MKTVCPVKNIPLKCESIKTTTPNKWELSSKLREKTIQSAKKLQMKMKINMRINFWKINHTLK